MEIIMEVLQKVKNRTARGSCCTTPAHVLEGFQVIM
jgi:hypothetical protein